MSEALRLVIFDVDGTLVDSQGDILAAMASAFSSVGAACPSREAVLGIVGLSLDVAMPKLAPDQSAAICDQLVDAYKDAYMTLRAQTGAAESSPLYPGALDVLHTLNAQDNVLLGIATGKSRRGLDKLLEGHGLTSVFVTEQVADFHPSKPHPSMVLAALAETGVAPEHAVMVGDTSFDMAMAKAAGVRGIGVSWGYHDIGALGDADCVIDAFGDLPRTLDLMWEL